MLLADNSIILTYEMNVHFITSDTSSIGSLAHVHRSINSSERKKNNQTDKTD